MNVPDKLIEDLRIGKQLRVQMVDDPSLRSGWELVNKLQRKCNFPLVYLQVLGDDPQLIVWRMQSMDREMEGYKVHEHQA